LEIYLDAKKLGTTLQNFKKSSNCDFRQFFEKNFGTMPYIFDFSIYFNAISTFNVSKLKSCSTEKLEVR